MMRGLHDAGRDFFSHKGALMSIAILAYGSLIWDEENLAEHITGGWARGEGPGLPVEFSRISPKRKRALVLVVDETAPAPVPTSVTTSRRESIHEAAHDLARRERAPIEAIGMAERGGGRARNCPAGIGRIVNGWLEAQETYRAAVWTNLPGNFPQVAGEDFTHAAGLRWLKGLGPESLEEAWRYITFAPEETDTPFRRFLARDDWWRGLARRYRPLKGSRQP